MRQEHLKQWWVGGLLLWTTIVGAQTDNLAGQSTKAIDSSLPRGVTGLAADDKNFSYYHAQEMYKRATAYLLWTEQGYKSEAYVMRDAAEFRGYVLAQLERSNVDWRKTCDSPTAIESPNAIVYQIALAMDAEQNVEQFKGNGGMAVAWGVFRRCMKNWLDLKK